VLTEILIGGVLALLVLVWVFGSALAFLPLLSAVVSVLTMQIAIWGLTYATSIHINPAVQFIVALLGLGLSIDYSLLLVNRWREERDAGSDNRTAVLASMRKAGHSVAFSGTVASLGLFALIVVPISFLQGVGLSGLFIPSIAAITALCTVPLLLDTVGPGLDRVRLRKRKIETEQTPKFWTRAARRIVRRPRIAAALGSAILIALSVIGLGININNAPAGNLANSGPAHDGFPTGILTPVPVLVPHGQSPTVFAASLRGLPDIHGVLTPADTAWAHGGSSVVTVLPKTEIGTSSAGQALNEVHAHAPAGALVGGSQVQAADVSHQIGQYFPILLAVVALITFVLLARGMRSLLLPAKAVLLNVLSVGAAYGVLVLIWQHGIGSQSIWGVPATGSISAYVPMLLFGFLFGVSMDYEVFILARMREAYDRDGDTEKAVIEGIGRTGRLVTSAALILVLALTSLSMAPDPTVKMMGTGMAAGVLIDALVVRTLLTPALVVLFGRANWYLPRWAAKALFLKPDAPKTVTHPAEEFANHR
jgi:RND superfamily putative drug exporter